MEGLNWVKQDCSAIKDDAIRDNQTFCSGFILRSQQVFQNFPALLNVCEISIFPSTKSVLIMLFLCTNYQNILCLFSFKGIYFLMLGIHFNKLLGLAFSLPLQLPGATREAEHHKGLPSTMGCVLSLRKHTLSHRSVCTAERKMQTLLSILFCFYNPLFSKVCLTYW